MESLDLREKLWGGVFGVISILAAIGEMFTKGLSTESILSTIKDVSGTMVVVVLLVVVIKTLIPRKYQFPFEKRLQDALTKWQKINSNMIIEGVVVKVKNNEKYDLSIRTNLNDFYNAVPISKRQSMFLRMPLLTEENYRNPNIVLEFTMTKAVFFDDLRDDDKDLMPLFNQLNSKFCAYINAQFQGFALASGNNKSIIVHIVNPIISDEDIEKLIEVINGMYQAYLVAANIKIK